MKLFQKWRDSGLQSFRKIDGHSTSGTPLGKRGEDFREFVDGPGEDCLDDPIGVENPATLEADFEPYLEVSGLNVTGPRQLEPNVETLDVNVTVENTGPGNASSESVALYLDDQREDGRGQVLLADAKTNITRNGTERMAVSSDLQSAALWRGRDGAEAEDFTAGSAPTYGSFTAPQTAGEHVYLYRYDGAEQDLVRDLYIDGSLDSSQIVARFIQNQGDVSFSRSGDLVTVTLTSTSGGASQTIELELALRVR
jgi:hypothetical protein